MTTTQHTGPHALSQKTRHEQEKKTLKDERMDYGYALSGHCIGTMPVPDFLKTFLGVQEILQTPDTVIDFGAALNPKVKLTEKELSKIWVR